jgi:hypothetical protein
MPCCGWLKENSLHGQTPHRLKLHFPQHFSQHIAASIRR